MTKYAEALAAECERMCAANIGYDQGNRWGADECDCSSLVYRCIYAIDPSTSLNRTDPRYTGTLRRDLRAVGFYEVPKAQHRRGDVLLNEAHHVLIDLGGGKVGGARIDERGKASGGQGGDQTGNEVSVHGYYDYPWDVCLRPPDVEVGTEKAGKWVKQDGKWWYRHDDGSYTKSGWEMVGGKWYRFDGEGWMLTGWQKVGGKWYYLSSSGAMLDGWQSIGGAWYYLTPGNGAMKTGWIDDGGTWYYCDGSGKMLTGWQSIGGKWYYLKPNGAMATGWQKVGGKWYYLTSTGAMATGWVNDGGKWYYADGDGEMQTGWLKKGGEWYFLNADGSMSADTVQLIGGTFYAFDDDGEMNSKAIRIVDAE